MNGTPVYIVRHGATLLNNQTDLSQDRIRGHLDVPLAPEGIQDAHRAAEELKPYGIEIIVCSSLQRARQTAQIIGQTLGVPVQVNPNLMPWNLGDFQGTSTKAALPKIAEYAQNQPDQPVPGGESFNAFKERAFKGLGEAIQLAAGKVLCVVTHHRNEMLFRAWEEAGEPPDHQIDFNTFLQKGDPPGGVFKMQVNPQALASGASPMGGASAMQSGLSAAPPNAAPQLPVPTSAAQAGGMPPPVGPGQQLAAPQPNPMMQEVMQKLQQIQKAIQLLRDDTPRGYRIDIEVDTMVAGDQQQEREDATEFLKAVVTFVQGAGQIVMVQPDFAPLAAKMLQFGVRRFRTGRDLESAIDEYADKVTKAPPKPPQADPAHQKAQVDAKVAQTKAQAEITKSQMDAKSAQANDQRQQQIMMLEFQLKQQEFKFRMAEMEREQQFKVAEHNRKMAEAHMAHQQKLQAAMMPQPMPNGAMQ